jgi:short-subunit dehydrogenase
MKKQVIVITGASSGIGLATAEQAAAAGAKVALAARSDLVIEQIAARIRNQGGDAVAVTCDVGRREDVENLAQVTIRHFGTIDTWINNAGTGMYGMLEEVHEGDARRLFDTNFWGVVNGSLVALPYLKAHGGALINIGSEVSEAAVPLLGMYVASKHAVKGFTDSLRIEIEQVQQAPVAITLIQPTAVDTPFPQHSKNYMAQEPKLPEPMLDPHDVAKAILRAAVKPTRNKKVGAKATLNTWMATLLPASAERFAAQQVDDLQADEPPQNPEGALFHASETTESAGQVHGLHAKG